MPATLRVAVTHDTLHRNLEWLCPGRALRWGRCEFTLNPPEGTQWDYWITYCGTFPRYELVCARENTLFVAGEPPAKKTYPAGYYAQFHRIVTAHANAEHPRIIPGPLGLPWHVGLNLDDQTYLYGYDELKALRPTAKENKISVICSNLRSTEGQRRRLEFLDQLKARLGDRIVHFGRGFTPIKDKMQAIAPYCYHLALENSQTDHYWTEKMADAYLGWAFPIYLGAPNIADYFSTKSFATVDSARPGEAVALIEHLLAQPASLENEAAIARSRDLVLDTYNPFAVFSWWAEQFHVAAAIPGPQVMRSHKAFRPFPLGLLYRLRSARTVNRPITSP